MDLLVSSALEEGSSLPSFFEMFMSRQIQLSLKPAARHAYGAIAARWQQLYRMSHWFDEAYLVAVLMVEGRFLANHSCLLSESFYGLRRCRYERIHGPPHTQPEKRNSDDDAHTEFERNGAGYGPGQGLRDRDRRKALLTAVIVPYIMDKLDAAYQRQSALSEAQGTPRSEQNTTEFNTRTDDVNNTDVGHTRNRFFAASRRAGISIRQRLARLWKLFVQIYPLLRASFEGSFLVYQWLYLFRRSAYFSPLLRLSGMVVRRVTTEDIEEDAVAARVGSSRREHDGAAVREGSPGSFGERIGQYGRVLLIAAVVGFKVMEWWTRVEAQEGSSWRRRTTRPPPPPPQPPSLTPSGCGVPADPGACPVCGRARVNPTLCSSSGFVFCFMCLSSHVREHGECPVTGIETKENNLLRLYDDEGERDRSGGG